MDSELRLQRFTLNRALVALLLALVAGCGKKAAPYATAAAPNVATAPGTPETPAAPGTPGAPGAPGTPAPGKTTGAAPAAAPTGELVPIMDARKKLTSYEMKTTGPRGERVTEVKLDNGRPVRTRMTTPNGYMLIMTDQQASYAVDTQTKTATKMTMGGRGGPGGAGGSRGGGRPQGAGGSGAAPGARGQGGPGASGGRGGPGGAGGAGGPGGRGSGGRGSDLAAIEALHPKVSATKLDGMDCWLLQWTDPQGQQAQMWLDKQYGLTRQSQTPQGTSKFSYSKINAVPAKDFELPGGLTIKDAPAGQGGSGGRGGGGVPGGNGNGGGGSAPPAGGGAGF